jgi:putative endonuclease
MTSPRNKLGIQGEGVAARYLETQGYKVLARKYRSRFGEMDIIALCDDIFVFVEVKTKGDDTYGRPDEMVGHTKKTKLIRLAQSYLKDQLINSEDTKYQIDVISVIINPGQKPRIRHFQNITL